VYALAALSHRPPAALTTTLAPVDHRRYGCTDDRCRAGSHIQRTTGIAPTTIIMNNTIVPVATGSHTGDHVQPPSSQPIIAATTAPTTTIAPATMHNHPDTSRSSSLRLH
jgi:hypothetical protein